MIKMQQRVQYSIIRCQALCRGFYSRHLSFAAAPAEGQADGAKDVFATPFERQGSLIHLEPMDATGTSSDDRASQNGEGVVYCPVGTPAADSRQAGASRGHAR